MTLLMTPAEIDADRAGWKERRRRTPEGEWVVTASEIASVCGIAPRTWPGPFALYWKKLQGEETTPTEEMRRGSALEPIVLDEFASEHEDQLVLLRGGMYAHPEYPWRVATLDGQAVEADTYGWMEHPPTEGDLEAAREAGGLFGVEAKTAVPMADYGWEELTDKIPTHIRAQALWQAHVRGVPRVYVPVKPIASWAPVRTYIIDAETDDAKGDIEFMVAQAEEFTWRLAHEQPPPVDDLPETTETLRRLHPGLEDRAVLLPIGLSRRYRRALAAVNRAKRRADLARNQIMDRMGNATIGVTRDTEEGKARDDYLVRVVTRTASERPAYTVEASDGPVHRLNACGWAKGGQK
jgi:YqaJ-like viral recombinase domain